MATLLKVGRDERQISLLDAEREGLEWDVFVSYKSNDYVNSIRIARRIQRSGLSAWVDRLDPTIMEDGPLLDHYIESVLSRSLSLLALVTDLTHESWWVPFEIGIAFELRRYLSSFADRSIELPSFLEKHPRLANDSDVDRWCERLMRLKRNDHKEYVANVRGRLVMARKREEYYADMRKMTREFS